MKILFMGTPDFAKTILEALYTDGEEIVGVVTQPDKPKGRGYVLTPPPVKVYAESVGLPVYQPITLKDGAFLPVLEELKPELILVAAYGKILPKYVLDYAVHGCVNAHASLLPKYRGAAPIQRAILDGETETGVTAMQMDVGLDTGDMLLVERVAITPEDNFETVHDKLAVAGATVIRKTVAAIKAGTLTATPQPEEFTYAAKIERADCILDFSAAAKDVHNRIRGLSPIPLSQTRTPDGKLLKIVESVLLDEKTDKAPGTVLSADAADGLFRVACGDGVIGICRLLPEGKGRMSAADFIRGRKIAVGDVLKYE
ncbi:MAG: methionyl-tRNA formyltransferase [Clostridia bacterium]|nr:methionyl-tRNA formyltransferase [Clostridia bacterium]